MTLEPAEWSLVMQSALFRGWEQTEMEQLLSGGGWEKRVYRRGEVIYAPHDFFRSLGILLSGSVLVSKGAFPVNKLKAGDLFGAAALFNEEPDYVTTLRARGNCAALLLSEEKVEELLSQSAQVRRNYIRYLSERIRFLSARLEPLTGPTVEAKLLCYLEQRNREGQVILDCSLSELAKRLSMGRASLYRAFDILEDQNMILRDGKKILLIHEKG